MKILDATLEGNTLSFVTDKEGYETVQRLRADLRARGEPDDIDSVVERAFHALFDKLRAGRPVEGGPDPANLTRQALLALEEVLHGEQDTARRALRATPTLRGKRTTPLGSGARWAWPSPPRLGGGAIRAIARSRRDR